MTAEEKLELLLLHALPLDGTMWAGRKEILPGSTYTPMLYPLGDNVGAWAAAALKLVKGDRLVVVGCSVGGSCALEVAVAAPDRVAALVLIDSILPVRYVTEHINSNSATGRGATTEGVVSPRVYLDLDGMAGGLSNLGQFSARLRRRPVIERADEDQ